MPYYQIKDKFIFLHFNNYQKLNDIALKDKEPSWRLRSHISGKVKRLKSSDIKLLTNYTKRVLLKIFIKNGFTLTYRFMKTFLKNYLIYCMTMVVSINHFYREIHEDTMQTLFPDLYYDKDCSYELALFPAKGLFKKQEKVFSTNINTKDVVSIKGELNDFTIVMKNKAIHFDKLIRVIDK